MTDANAPRAGTYNRPIERTGASDGSVPRDAGPRVAAVLTVFNRRETTLACLRSIRDQGGHDARVDVFVCDDASTDGTAAAVAEAFPEVTLLHGDGSLFWNGGMRRAFAAALATDPDFSWWLNDDTHLDDDALARLLATARELRERGGPPAIVAGATRHPDDGWVTYSGVRRPRRWRPMSFERVEPGDEPRSVETMNGNCVLIPRAVARAVGNVDPAYRQKMGDFDYGLRARAAGLEVWMAPGTIGTCATHPARRTDERPLRDELRRLYSVKELPPRAWLTFTRRHAGPLWPVYFASPYVRRGWRLVAERARLAGTRGARRGSPSRSARSDSG